MTRLLILRPEPGASETARRARSLGMDPVIAPLFEIRPRSWKVPDGHFDALLLTSANAARNAGQMPDLPCYAVGEATADAARGAGLAEVIAGPSDGQAALALAAAHGHKRILHLCGREHIAAEHSGVTVVRHIVYAAEAAPELPANARAVLAGSAVVMLHSPRAARLLSMLVPDRSVIRIVAISAAAADAAGSGWASIDVPAMPRDEALLELAAQLCKAGTSQMTGRDR
ncbi:uroporphyrinogen-III synthase [Allosphingosinicella deserti]|uniref:Uroporphyrinogen III synthase HEM4 n=1 Tax=Allosphingosinicella deserti TaxID=2116704 RepID=A0A2P7QUI3_9SPHN|nr:uroporphyrinogen-III synthase [Sphingomonas deserti]PSJ41600.1 uroporphyrinogen III synthase HEM4 [Sphingomonas deserti]